MYYAYIYVFLYMYYAWIKLDYSLWSKQYLIFNYLKEELSVTVRTINHLATAKTSPLPFVFWLLSCKVLLAGQQFQPHQPTSKPEYPTNNSYPCTIWNNHEKSTAQQRQCTGFYLGIKRGSVIYSHTKEFNTNSLSSHRFFWGFCTHPHTYVKS